jgi:hypothetical protein
MATLTDDIVRLAREKLPPAAIVDELARKGRSTTVGFVTKTLSDKRKIDPSIPIFNKTRVDSVDRDVGEGSPSSKSTLDHRRSLTHDFLSAVMTRAQQREDILSRVGLVAFILTIEAGPMTGTERGDLLDSINEPDLEKAARGVERFVRARLGPLVDAKNREPTRPLPKDDGFVRAWMESQDIRSILHDTAEYKKLLAAHPHDKRFDERLAYALKMYTSPQFSLWYLKEAHLLYGALGYFPPMEPISQFKLEQGYKPLNF